MKAKITFTVEFNLRPATGVNPKGEDFEIVDSDGIRLMYGSDLDDIEDEILQIVDPALSLGGKVTTEEEA